MSIVTGEGALQAIAPTSARKVRGLSVSPRIHAAVALVSIVLLAASLRLWAVSFGLPYCYHPDEPGKVLAATQMVQQGDLNPHYFQKPSLQIYLNAATQAVYYAAGRLTGRFHSRADLHAPEMIAPAVGLAPMPELMLMGRLITVGFALGSVVLIAAIAYKLTHRRSVAVLAALMLAVSPSHVAFSRLIHQDVPMLFFLLLAIGASLDVLQRGRWRDYVLAGVACGLAMGTKYNGIFCFILPIAAHFLQRPVLAGTRRLSASLGVGLIAFLITTPYALVTPTIFAADVLFETLHYAVGHPGMEGQTLRWYAGYALGYEGPAILLGLATMAWAVFRWHRRDLILLAIMPSLYFLIIASLPVRNEQTLLPVMPFQFLFAALGVVQVADWLHARLRVHPTMPIRNRWVTAMTLLLLVGVLAVPAVRSMAGNRKATRLDGRETARQWLDTHLAPGSRVAVEAYGPYIDPRKFHVIGSMWMAANDAPWYRAQGCEYFVLAEGASERFLKHPDQYPQIAEKYRDLIAAGDLVRRFDEGDYDVTIYRFKPRG